MSGKKKKKPLSSAAQNGVAEPVAKVNKMNSSNIDDFNGYLLHHRDRTTMQVNGLKATFHMPKAVRRIVNADGAEGVAGLPPGNPRPAFTVDEYPGCPVSWEHGSAKASSYFVPIMPEHGMWLDFNQNFQHTHHVAAVISVQGINPLTGQKTDPIRLEQYRENCPVHNIAFKQDLFCEKCNHKWPSQNYISTTGTPNGLLWLDGFLASDGVVRQWFFTEEEMKGVAAQIIGKDRVHAIGIAFYLSKNPKPKPVVPTYRSYSGGISLAATGGGKVSSMGTKSITNTPSWDTLASVGDVTLEALSFSASCNTGPQGPAGPVGVAGHTPEVEEKTSGGIPLPDSSDDSRGIIRSASGVRRRSRGPSGSSASAMPEHKVKKIEVGAGAKIDQKIYRDPENLDFWQDEPVGFIYVNYSDIATCKAIIEAGKRQEKSEGFLDGVKLAN